jgi:hypothetical protein
MKTLIFALIAFAAFPASAEPDLTGHWVATSGTYTDIQGKKNPCAGVEIDIKQTPDAIEIVRYNANCGLASSDWGPDPLKVRNGIVFNLDDDVIGTYKEGVLVTNERIKSITYRFDLTLTQNESGESLTSFYGVKNVLGSLLIDSVLTRQRNP